MSPVTEQLRKHFEKSTGEEIQKEYDELKHWNEIGPTCDEYFNLIHYLIHENNIS